MIESNESGNSLAMRVLRRLAWGLRCLAAVAVFAVDLPAQDVGTTPATWIGPQGETVSSTDDNAGSVAQKASSNPEKDPLATTALLAEPSCQPPEGEVDVQAGFIILPDRKPLEPDELRKDLENGGTFLGDGPQPRVSRKYAVGDLVSAARASLGLSETKARRPLQQAASAASVQPPYVKGTPPSLVWSGKKLVVQASGHADGRA